MKILMILTSHDKLGDTGRKTGFCLEEFTMPYYIFKDAGDSITLASPLGGQPLLDPGSFDLSEEAKSTKRFKYDSDTQMLLANTLKLAGLLKSDFDAIFFPGGPGTIGLFPKMETLAA